jgi:hypothetical protein
VIRLLALPAGLELGQVMIVIAATTLLFVLRPAALSGMGTVTRWPRCW